MQLLKIICGLLKFLEPFQSFHCPMLRDLVGSRWNHFLMNSFRRKRNAHKVNNSHAWCCVTVWSCCKETSSTPLLNLFSLCKMLSNQCSLPYQGYWATNVALLQTGDEQQAFFFRTFSSATTNWHLIWQINRFPSSFLCF